MARLMKIVYGLAVILLSIALPPSIARCAPDAPAPAGAEGGGGATTQIAVAAVKSVDAVQAFAKELNLPLPPNADPQQIAQMFPFIGQGGMATDKPIGVVLFGGPNFNLQQSMAYVIPVKAQAATADAIKKAGAMPAPGQADVLSLNGMNFRRTADYLIASPDPAIAAIAKPEALAAALKNPDTLVKISVDVKAIRTSMPEQVKQLIDASEQGLKSVQKHESDPAADAGLEAAQKLGTGAARKAIDTTDRFEIALASNDAGVHLAFSAAPVKAPKLATATHPGMPAGVVARFDLNASIMDTMAAHRDEFLQMASAGDSNSGTLTPEQKQQGQALLGRVYDLMSNTAGGSVGVEMKGGAPVVYIVQHLAKPVDYIMEVRQIVAKGNAISPQDKESVDLQTYTSGGVKVLRAVDKTSGKTDGYVDIAQRGDDVFMTISSAAFRYIDPLLAAPAEAPGKDLATGYLDLGKVLDAVVATPNSPAASMPPDMLKQLHDMLNGQRLTLSATAEGDTGTFDISVSKGLIQNAPKLMQMFGGMGGGGANPGSGAPGGNGLQPPLPPAGAGR